MTPIDLGSIDNYPNSIFLGSWCNHFKATKKFKNIKSLEYHWADREKFDNDYRYLHDLVERLLPEVSNYLNKLHSMNKKMISEDHYWTMADNIHFSNMGEIRDH